MYSTLRGVFLTFVFPKLISLGRRITSKRAQNAQRLVMEQSSGSPEREPLLASQSPPGVGGEASGNKDSSLAKEQANHFDLKYTVFSLFADGALTLLCSFVREGWQMYLVAAILPFAAGTGSAAKGSVLQMIDRDASSSKRTDALAGISLVENMARLSTSGSKVLYQIPADLRPSESC